MERISSVYSDMDSASDSISVRGQETLVDASMAGGGGGAGGAPVDDKVFVAVGREVNASKSTLLWALQNAGKKKVVVIHVHQPAQTISVLGGKFPVSQLKEQEVKAFRETERQEVSKILDEYIRMCTRAGVHAEKEYIEMASIEKGIVELIKQFRIGRLVMGAAADKKYSRKMIEPKSKKAIYVRQHAPPSCHIWFICKDRLINTRESTMSCITGEAVTDKRLIHVDSEGVGVRRTSSPSTYDWSRLSTPWSRSLGESSFDDLEQSSTISIALSSGFSPRSDAAGRSPFSSMRSKEREPALPLLALPPNNDYLRRPSVSNLSGSSMSDRLYEQLEQAMTEAETSKRQAFEESMRRRKAEKDTLDAIRKVKLAENLYYDELAQRKVMEEELAKSNEELDKVKYERDEILEKLRVALEQKALLENRLERSDTMVKGMEEKVTSVVELFKNYKMH